MGQIIYEGPSALDGAPIVAILTGESVKSRNPKTGAMLQTYILRADVDPLAASRAGVDASICGDCPLRGAPNDNPRGTATDRGCYVSLHHAPLSVWRAYKRGAYSRATDLAALGAGRHVRLGSYGDPAAIPVGVWGALTRRAAGWAGYTHRWRALGKEAPLARYCMASVEKFSMDSIEAHALGWRTFRVRPMGETQGYITEFVCPASEEGGYKSTCMKCGLCTGKGGKGEHARSVVITAHGNGAKYI